MEAQINVENAAKEYTNEDLMDLKLQTVTEEQWERQPNYNSKMNVNCQKEIIVLNKTLAAFSQIYDAMQEFEKMELNVERFLKIETA